MLKNTYLAAGLAILTLAATAAPASAQSYYGSRGYDRDRNGGDAATGLVVGALVGGIAGAALGNGDNRYVAGGALAGAALGAATSSGGGGRYGSSSYGYTYGGYNAVYGGAADCDYWRDGRCWRNRGHWERENGINSRDRNWDRRDDRRQDRRDWRSDRRDERRDDRRDDRRWRSY